MISKKALIGVVLALAVVSVPLMLNKAAHAQPQGGDQYSFSSKLDQVLANQKTIMDQLSALKQELAIVKIRVTQKV